MNGLHLIADLYGSRCTPRIMCDSAILAEICVNECRAAGLTPLGSYFYQFTADDGQRAGVTGTVVLAESHLAIHTWPETGDVTLDVYVCDFSMDNSEKARQLFHRLLELLEAKEITSQEVIRGRVRAAGRFVPVDTA